MDERTEIYDMISHVLTDWEEGNACELDLYDALVRVQNAWGTVITKGE